jgi:hypothetical protein
MIDREQPNNDAVDKIVKQYVEREIGSVDATGLVARVRATHQQGNASNDRLPHRRTTLKPPLARRSLAFTWVAMTTVATMLAFAGGRYLGPRSANAAVVLRSVQFEHARAVDHCYRVQYAPDPRYWDGKNQLEGPSTSTLWTRGDRFWSDCTMGSLQLKLGREANGIFWVSPSSSKGIRFTNDATDLPEAVAVICAVNSMSVPRLMEEVLADFDLHADPSAQHADGAKTLVWARLKPGRSHPLLSDALLEINPETNVLNRLVLWTTRDGHPGGTVTYTLLESSEIGDDRYRLESHLDVDAEIEVHTLRVSKVEDHFGE